MYQLGLNKIIYQSDTLQAGKVVYMILWNPRGEKSDKFSFKDIGEGIYQLEIVFKYPGSYLGRIYEDEQYQGSRIFTVNNYRGIIVPYIKEMYGW